MNKVRQDEEKGYRERKVKNGYEYLGKNREGKAVYEKGNKLYREEEHRYLVRTNMVRYWKPNFEEANNENSRSNWN